MSLDKSKLKITVLSVGASPVEFVDDLFTESRHSLAPGELLSKGANGGGWEPTPLPAPEPERGASAAAPGGGWRPHALDRLDPEAPVFVVDLARDTETRAEAFDAMSRGDTVRVQVRQATSFALSQISSLAEAAKATGGQIEVELHGDG